VAVRPAEAVAAAREAVRLKPQQWEPFVVLAEALLAAENTQSGLAARDAVDRALALSPNNNEVLVLAGRVALALGDLRTARARYEQVLAVSPEDAAARVNLAVLDLHRSRTTAAADRFQVVVAANPGNPQLVRNVQLGATMWLRQLHLATSGLYLACWLAAATLSPGAVRDGVAALVAAGTVVLTGLAYRRLPSGTRRMVRWPAVALKDDGTGLRSLRRSHVILMALAVYQVAIGLVMLTTTLPLWTTLQLFATAGAVPALIRVLHLWKRAASRARMRWRSGPGTGDRGARGLSGRRRVRPEKAAGAGPDQAVVGS
jgi:tetratricopeptide (TPR) repeat protein